MNTVDYEREKYCHLSTEETWLINKMMWWKLKCSDQTKHYGGFEKNSDREYGPWKKSQELIHMEVDTGD